MIDFISEILAESWGIYIISFIAYLIGSLSGSMILGTIKGVDIRKQGSGNAGATNALRTIGPMFAIGVMLIDVLKGFLPVFLIGKCNPALSIELFTTLIGASSVLGHVYPIYYNFKGGKGAGTLGGVIIALFPECFIYVLAVWLISLILTGYVGLSTILAGISFVIVTYFKYSPELGAKIFTTPFGIFSIFIAIFLVFTHRENIKRMINGNENQFKKIMFFK